MNEFVTKQMAEFANVLENTDSKQELIAITKLLLTETYLAGKNDTLESAVLNGEYRVEHCGTKDCPECSQEAYKAGYSDGALSK